MRAGWLLAAIVVVAGCGVVEEKRQAYRASESIAPLRLPESLTPPANDYALMLPDLRSAAVAGPFDSRPPAPVDLPVEAAPRAKLEIRE